MTDLLINEFVGLNSFREPIGLSADKDDWVRYAVQEDESTDQVLAKEFYFPRPQRLAPRITRFVIEQEFEGVVLTVDEESRTFFARLVDQTAAMPDEDSEFLITEISQDDRHLIYPGSFFSWTIGRSERSGTTQRVSEIRFRRGLRFTKERIEQAKERGSKMFALLTEDE